MNLPKRIFFTGVPGSRWSGIAQTIESLPGLNTSDRTHERDYSHNSFSGHKGAYFGRMMEFHAKLDADYIDSAWKSIEGTRLIKSHDWAYCLYRIKQTFPDDWIMLVYREDDASFDWWKAAGGFDICYPSYASYRNDDVMKREISWQNQSILSFVKDNELKLENFSSDWIEKHFGVSIETESSHEDIKVAILK